MEKKNLRAALAITNFLGKLAKKNRQKLVVGGKTQKTFKTRKGKNLKKKFSEQKNRHRDLWRKKLRHLQGVDDFRVQFRLPRSW